MNFLTFLGIATIGYLVDEFVRWNMSDSEKGYKKSVLRRQTKNTKI